MAASSDEDLDGIIFGSRLPGGQTNVEVLLEQYKLFVEWCLSAASTRTQLKGSRQK